MYCWPMSHTASDYSVEYKRARLSSAAEELILLTLHQLVRLLCDCLHHSRVAVPR